MYRIFGLNMRFPYYIRTIILFVCLICYGVSNAAVNNKTMNIDVAKEYSTDYSGEIYDDYGIKRFFDELGNNLETLVFPTEQADYWSRIIDDILKSLYDVIEKMLDELEQIEDDETFDDTETWRTLEEIERVYEELLKYGHEFSCNEGGSIKVGKDIEVRNKKMNILFFKDNSNSFDITIVPDDGYRIASVNGEENPQTIYNSDDINSDFNVVFSLQDESFEYELDGIVYVLESPSMTATVKCLDGSFNKTDIVIPSTITYNNDTYSVTTIGDNAFSGTNGGSVIAEVDFTVITEFNNWYQFGDGQEGGVALGSEGLEITVGTQTGQLWQPQVEVINGCFNLEENANYKVIITAKYPSDGTLQLYMGSWLYPGEEQFPVTSTGDFQTDEFVFEGWKYTDDGCILMFQCGDFLGTTIIKSIKVIKLPDNSNLTSITIPSSVTTIGDRAFYGCSGLKDFISKIETPFEIMESVFSSETYTNATLTVPKGTKSAYQSTSYWNKFATIDEANGNDSRIPSGYTEVEYIQNDGYGINNEAPYINTNYIPNNNTRVKCDFQYTVGGTHRRLLGAGKWDQVNTYCIEAENTMSQSTPADLYLRYGYGTSWNQTGKKIDMNRHEIDFNKNLFYMDGELQFTCDNYIFTASYPMALFGFMTNTFCNGSTEWMNGRIYSCQIYDNDVLVRDFVPAKRNSDSKVGLYDVINDVFYTSPNNKEFTAGPEVGHANMTLTAKNYTREYGDENPTFEYTTSGGALDGTPKITCSATNTSPVGTYPIKIEKGSVANDDVDYVDGTLTITKAPLTITAKSYSREEGEDNPTFEVTYDGFKNDETSAVLTKMPTVSTTATKDSPAGTYDITASDAEAQNYSFTYVNGTLTVTEKDLVSFTQNGITYLGTKSTLKANFQSVDNSLMNIEIPSTVDYDGKTYEVSSFANDALSNRTFNYVSLPSTITSIEAGTFNNSTLGALIWNADASLSPDVFNNMAMPTTSNFLLYVNSKSYAPSNVSNVVVGSTASSVTLADATNTRFYCPIAFTAQTISYTHNYSMKTGGSGMGWETLALPFDVQKIEHKTKGTLTPFAAYNGSSSQRPFWLYELGSNGFRRTNAIKANTPYIISMPNNSAYDDEYILAGDVTFSATNATVVETGSIMTSTSNGKTFVPAFAVMDPSSSVYALNVVNKLVSNSGSYDAGSRFINNMSVYPFEAYMTSSSGARSLAIEFDADATGIDQIPIKASTESIIEIFAIGGQRIAKVRIDEYQTIWQQLPAGVYIVNGRKVVK